mmetsp:Transcript_42227/g.112927  ORF Transcript_42227/g.112927 Transcript_42227/m.112927 type:complete len:86 (-) Transcript_42227:19-276(-)
MFIDEFTLFFVQDRPLLQYSSILRVREYHYIYSIYFIVFYNILWYFTYQGVRRTRSSTPTTSTNNFNFTIFCNIFFCIIYYNIFL